MLSVACACDVDIHTHKALIKTTATTTTTTRRLTQSGLLVCACLFWSKPLAGDDGFRCSRLWQLRSEAEKGAPAPLVAATRPDDRAHGVGRSPAPLFPSEVQGPRRTTLHEAR